MAPADALPALMEHDVTVVNTFLQVSDRPRPRGQRLQRAQTAPVAAPDEEDQLETEEPQAEEGEEDHFEAARDIPEPRVEKEVTEDTEESSEVKPVKMNAKKLQSLRTLNRFETPDPWDLEALCKSLDESPEEPALPAKSASSSKPRLLHSATPDQWEWDAMVQAEKMTSQIQQPQPGPAHPPPAMAQPSQAQAFNHPPQPCVAQAAPVVSLLTVPVTLAMPVASPAQVVQAGCEYPRLLGSMSPASQGSPKPTSPSQSPRVRPGTLETTHLDQNRELVKWNVDGAKFDSNSERLLSPEFQLRFPGHSEPFTFRMVINATETGGKHGAGFKKAKGRGSIQLKCSSAVPSDVDSVTALVSIGEGTRKQIGLKPIEHNFGDKTCCQLRNGDEADWDFKQSVSRDAKSCEISVEIHL
ncbi:unnamed protein product [Symbiodinium pilosum]|uniref:Uncharacterized protein n=1 Tax=Symbiodinium pilosum TaxID=2952 RepID=A0A812TAM4_SYMPI|nr:unnamed protein product [Symbiodinium pilosum]